jgi:hypothetical protein
MSVSMFICAWVWICKITQTYSDIHKNGAYGGRGGREWRISDVLTCLRNETVHRPILAIASNTPKFRPSLAGGQSRWSKSRETDHQPYQRECFRQGYVVWEICSQVLQTLFWNVHPLFLCYGTFSAKITHSFRNLSDAMTNKIFRNFPLVFSLHLSSVLSNFNTVHNFVLFAKI